MHKLLAQLMFTDDPWSAEGMVRQLGLQTKAAYPQLYREMQKRGEANIGLAKFLSVLKHYKVHYHWNIEESTVYIYGRRP